MWKLIAACLALGSVSLLLPSEPSYDPLAWLIWGRELAQFHLDTSGGPSWKPLPVVFTTLTAPFGQVDHGLPPALWMAVARAGALLAMAFAFRLAHRLAGGGVAGILGGLVAALALFLTPDWFQFAAHGSEAPIAVAFMLWAIERHLDGRVADAVVLGTLACLLRPELVPFLGLYGLWLWRAEPRLRKLVAGAFVLLPVLWVGPEWIGSGMPLGANLVEFSPLYDGNSTRFRLTVASWAGLVAAVLALALSATAFVDHRVKRLRYEIGEVKERMQIHADLARAVHAAGGANAVKAIGWSTTNRALQTRLAWELGVPMELTESLTDYRVVFRSSREPLVGRVYMTGRARHSQTLVRVGTFRVYRRDGITFPRRRREWRLIRQPFTGLLQGFHTSAGNGRIARARVVGR